jgi:hypothetical protein
LGNGTIATTAQRYSIGQDALISTRTAVGKVIHEVGFTAIYLQIAIAIGKVCETITKTFPIDTGQRVDVHSTS